MKKKKIPKRKEKMRFDDDERAKNFVFFMVYLKQTALLFVANILSFFLFIENRHNSFDFYYGFFFLTIA